MGLKILVGMVLLQVLVARNASAQQPVLPRHPDYGPNDTIVVYATVMPDGTLVPTSVLPDVEIKGKMPKWMAKQRKQWTRLRNAVYVTYPYAIEASKVINEINRDLAGVKDKGQRRKIVNSREKDLKRTFASKLMELSVYQGKVLMKLINRESGNNCFELVEEYKGGASARFWQTVAFVFGSSLKQPYEPGGEDAEMEKIVKEVAVMYGRG